MTGRSRIAAMIFSSPPQFGQCSRSSSKTRLSSRAQIALHAIVGQRRAGDVAAQLLQRLAVLGITAHGRVQAEPVDVGA